MENNLLKNVKLINYKNYEKLEEGIISHNTLLDFGSQLLNDSELLIKILSSKYKFIFIDEYQDTDEKILKTFDEKVTSKDIILGCFGDPYQKIYSGALYNLSDSFKKINKIENYRCSLEVIKILNKLRNDIQQEPQSKNLPGKVKFYYNPTKQDISPYIEKDFSICLDNFEKLFLTHKRISENQKCYFLFDKINKLKERDNLTSKEKTNIKFFNYLYFDLCKIFTLYTKKYIPEILTLINQPINNIKERDTLRKELNDFINICNSKTVEQIIEYIKTSIYIPHYNFEEKDLEFYNEIKDLNFSEFLNLYEIYYLNTKNISTNHGTKGAEFKNIYIELNNKDWNLYNYNKFFSNTYEEHQKIRVLNLLYVSFSRAEENLAINMTSELDPIAIDNIKNLFSEENFQHINTD